MSFSHAPQTAPLSLTRLDRVIDDLLLELEQGHCYDSLLITAASALSFLDHAFFDEPLQMRDLDLVLLADREVTRSWVTQLGESLSSGERKFLPQYVWPRQRCHPAHPDSPWLAGWGILFDVDGLELDLSIYHDAEAHETNGLLDIHRVRLPVSRRRPLRQLVDELGHSRPEEAIGAGCIDDPWGGYDSWRARGAQPVNWPGIKLEPIQASVRIVRDFVQKLGRQRLDSTLAEGLRRAVAHGTHLDTAYLDARNLLKVLTDAEAARELVVLEQLGIFEPWLPGLGNYLTTTDFSEVQRVLQVDDSRPWAETRLEALLGQLPKQHGKALIAAVAVAEPQLVGKLTQRDVQVGSNSAANDSRRAFRGSQELTDPQRAAM